MVFAAFMPTIMQVGATILQGKLARDAAQIKEVVEQTPYLYHQLTNALPFFQAFGIVIMPTTVILDEHGKVYAVVTGTNEGIKHTIETKLKEKF